MAIELPQGLQVQLGLEASQLRVPFVVFGQTALAPTGFGFCNRIPHVEVLHQMTEAVTSTAPLGVVKLVEPPAGTEFVMEPKTEQVLL